MSRSASVRSVRPSAPEPKFQSFSVEIRALAAPDTLSRLLEPLVVLQVMPDTVDAELGPDDHTMTVRIGLGRDLEAAERLVRRLAGAVTVVSARLCREPAVAAVAAR